MPLNGTGCAHYALTIFESLGSGVSSGKLAFLAGLVLAGRMQKASAPPSDCCLSVPLSLAHQLSNPGGGGVEYDIVTWEHLKPGV